MGLNHLDHFNIECVNLEATIRFYCDVLGLHVGERPPLPVPGAWLYGDNNLPTIHLIGTDPGQPDRPKVPSGRLHHICFACTGREEIRQRLVKHDVQFNTVVLPVVHFTQYFMQDPNGINVELNFPAEETRPEDLEAMKNRGREAYLHVPKGDETKGKERAV
jgi:catechol 2,3-dioxygenase-like lactoylglutathione lyase family enzyme